VSPVVVAIEESLEVGMCLCLLCRWQINTVMSMVGSGTRVAGKGFLKLVSVEGRSRTKAVMRSVSREEGVSLSLVGVSGSLSGSMPRNSTHVID
jgi:hypothetical protein